MNPPRLGSEGALFWRFALPQYFCWQQRATQSGSVGGKSSWVGMDDPNGTYTWKYELSKDDCKRRSSRCWALTASTPRIVAPGMMADEVRLERGLLRLGDHLNQPSVRCEKSVLIARRCDGACADGLGCGLCERQPQTWWRAASFPPPSPNVHARQFLLCLGPSSHPFAPSRKRLPSCRAAMVVLVSF